jgi:hypothetical protein
MTDFDAAGHKAALKALLEAEPLEFDKGGARRRFTMGRDLGRVLAVVNGYDGGGAPRKALVTWACSAYWELAAEAGRDGAEAVRPLPVPAKKK